MNVSEARSCDGSIETNSNYAEVREDVLNKADSPATAHIYLKDFFLSKMIITNEMV